MLTTSFLQCRTVAKVDLSAIRHNGFIAKSLFQGQKILSVLKADAYGHGIQGVLPAYETFTDWYAVATAEEAMLIRDQSSKPILLFGPAPKDKMIVCAERSITFTVGSLDYAKRLSDTLTESGLFALCHIKIDTGLNRSGIRWREDKSAEESFRKILQLPALRFSGVYTHFACAEGELDWEISYTRLQMNRFLNAVDTLSSWGYDFEIHHCCSTGGALVNPEFRMDMVRLGMLPMGMSYLDSSVEEHGLKPAMQWISYLTQIEDLPAGEPISYGCTYVAAQDMKIGVVSCGYADGYRRVYSNKSSVLIGGKKVKVIGRVAMDYLMIDITDVPNVNIGMEVVLLGSDGINQITALELSEFGESVSGEVTSAISSRVPRIYIDSQRGDLSV